jgi:uncharacterized membrane protein
LPERQPPLRAGQRREEDTIRVMSVGQAVFAATIAALGILGLVHADFAPMFTDAPDTLPGREALAIIVGAICVTCGLGLFWRRLAPLAARVLFAFLLLWTLLVKVSVILMHPLVEGSYQSWGEMAVLVAAAWILLTWFTEEENSGWARWFTGHRGVRGARVVFALALLAFGLSHVFYLDLTAPLVPAWLHVPVFWAYFTGATFFLAGLAILAGVYARLAAVLAAVQIGLFTVLVWAPMVASGHISEHRWVESVASWVITTAAWVVAESWGVRSKA